MSASVPDPNLFAGDIAMTSLKTPYEITEALRQIIAQYGTPSDDDKVPVHNEVIEAHENGRYEGTQTVLEALRGLLSDYDAQAVPVKAPASKARTWELTTHKRLLKGDIRTAVKCTVCDIYVCWVSTDHADSIKRTGIAPRDFKNHYAETHGGK